MELEKRWENSRQKKRHSTMSGGRISQPEGCKKIPIYRGEQTVQVTRSGYL